MQRAAEAVNHRVPADKLSHSHSEERNLARNGRSLSGVMTLVLVPWMMVVLFTAGALATLNFLAFAVVVLASGYAIIKVTVCSSARSQAIFLAPALGILVVSSLTALWVRLGLPLIWSMAVWLALAIVGLFALWRDRTQWTKSTVPHGVALVFFSALICAVYFLPSARNDLVEGRDGSFEWMFIDSQHFHAIAASIKDSGSPPKTPGTATAELLYHFGPYAPAAAISRLDGINLGDALARVTRGASVWALVLSCFGLGTLLSLRATGRSFGGIMSVAGLFFYGSLLSLFTDETTTLGRKAGAILFNIPKVEIPADGGPFDHLLGGHSALHGLVAITAIMGLCLLAREAEASPGKWTLAALVLPALATAVNLEASLYCFGIAAILLFWGRLGIPRSWASIALMACLFFVAWSIMGYSHSPDAGLATINKNPAEQWWPLAVWFIIGLGFRLIGLRWISAPFKDPVSVLVLTSVIGWLAFAFLIHLRDENERYGIYFLQSLFSIFAFSRLTSDWWRGVERPQMTGDWLKLARTAMILLLAAALLLRLALYLTHSHAWIASIRLQILPSLLLLACIVGTLTLMKRSIGFSKVASAMVMALLMIGFLAWVPTWLRFGLQSVPTDVTYSAGEVHGLKRLGQLIPPSERFATNKHDIERLSPLPPLAVSYGYSALSERSVLLEGYRARGEMALPWFNNLLRDNDLLFTTTDPVTLRDLAKIWKVRWLVARPGTDIAVPRPLPPWLVEQQDSGDLKIYRID